MLVLLTSIEVCNFVHYSCQTAVPKNNSKKRNKVSTPQLPSHNHTTNPSQQDLSYRVFSCRSTPATMEYSSFFCYRVFSCRSTPATMEYSSFFQLQSVFLQEYSCYNGVLKLFFSLTESYKLIVGRLISGHITYINFDYQHKLRSGHASWFVSLRAPTAQTSSVVSRSYPQVNHILLEPEAEVSKGRPAIGQKCQTGTKEAENSVRVCRPSLSLVQRSHRSCIGLTDCGQHALAGLWLPATTQIHLINSKFYHIESGRD